MVSAAASDCGNIINKHNNYTNKRNCRKQDVTHIVFNVNCGVTLFTVVYVLMVLANDI